MNRCEDLIRSESTSDITDFQVLHTTGPYMLSEVYHQGRKNGKYDDVHHIYGGDDVSSKPRSFGTTNWHKFGPYAEHMLSHTWVNEQRNLQLAFTPSVYDNDLILTDCQENENLFELLLFTDNFASETSWDIRDRANNT
eukprot:10572070-Ditylum_brightwellii.AAC.1